MKKTILLLVVMSAFSCRRSQPLIFFYKDGVKIGGSASVWKITENKKHIGYIRSDSVNTYINYHIKSRKDYPAIEFSNWTFDCRRKDTLDVEFGNIVVDGVNYKDEILKRFINK